MMPAEDADDGPSAGSSVPRGVSRAFTALEKEAPPRLPTASRWRPLLGCRAKMHLGRAIPIAYALRMSCGVLAKFHCF
jgi:hypothetical protein